MKLNFFLGLGCAERGGLHDCEQGPGLQWQDELEDQRTQGQRL